MSPQRGQKANLIEYENMVAGKLLALEEAAAANTSPPPIAPCCENTQWWPLALPRLALQVLEERQSALANGATNSKGGEGGLRLAYYGNTDSGRLNLLKLPRESR